MRITHISLANWWHEFATPSLTAFMRLISVLGSPLFVIVLTIVAVLALSFRRDWYAALMLGFCMGGGMLINTGLKHIFERTRPDVEPALVQAYGHSFPSGHVAAATLLYGCLAVLAAHRFANWQGRITAVLMAVFLVLLISISRLYLGVHYLTDVLAAQAVGIAWLAVSLTAVETLRRRRATGSRPIDPAGTAQ